MDWDRFFDSVIILGAMVLSSAGTLAILLWVGVDIQDYWTIPAGVLVGGGVGVLIMSRKPKSERRRRKQP